jgi:hypothetical protein
MKTVTRLCLECNKPLKGRIDKKFCNDYCRNVYNNKVKLVESTYVRHVNQVLKRNRRILENMLGTEDMSKQPKSHFVNRGFEFKYHTHQYINKKGNIYYFCYEYGFLPLEGDWYLIVKKKDFSGI